MAALKIELEWCRDSAGYELVDVPKRGKWIIGRGGPPIRYNPFEIEHVALLDFANAHSGERLRDFAGRYGYLSHRGYSRQGQVKRPIRSIRRILLDRDPTKTRLDPEYTVQYLEGESVDELVALAKLFKKVLASTSEKLSRSLSDDVEDLLSQYGSDVSFNFSLDSKRRIHPIISPASLISGLLVQLAQLAGGSSFRTCRLARCGSLFAAGGRGGLRADARFCSAEHRIEHNSRNRAKTFAKRPS
ncbi:hypothetical protein [Bradyrhizobium sp. Arg816]|uniref:hypothetical protein n=1 Tax=Bradyrhizobium sp. Arg816 TaxID=2998491 RepID=UPI00249DA70F|nr:hypothetical protein [Bradyrhizobium sp. Arg816]MDI3559996.1 hypothetical protein [Bradyrhizobium sp. Arg816]